MEKATRPPSILARISAALRLTIEVRAHRADARARERGWDVTVTGRHGLGRSYRDPRFDLLRSCPQCPGTGRSTGGGECGRCRGTGRIVHDPSRRSAG